MLSPRLALIAVLVLAVCGMTLRADEAEDRAVKAVEKLGGKVTRDDKQPGKPVIALDLSWTKMTDTRLKDLKDLKDLQSLILHFTLVTDVGMKELRDLKN